MTFVMYFCANPGIECRLDWYAADPERDVPAGELDGDAILVGQARFFDALAVVICAACRIEIRQTEFGTVERDAAVLLRNRRNRDIGNHIALHFQDRSPHSDHYCRLHPMSDVQPFPGTYHRRLDSM